MDSKTKVHLENEIIEQICKKTFGNEVQVGNILEYSGGAYNTSYAIELINLNKEVVLKVAPPISVDVLTYEKDLMRTEIEMSNIIREKTKVPQPELIDYNSDHSIIDSDYFFMSKLNGIQFSELKNDINKEQTDDIYRQLGKCVAQIHSVKGDFFGYNKDFTYKSKHSWRSTYFKLIQDLFDDAERIGLDFFVPVEDIMNMLEKAAFALDAVTVPTFVNFDISAGNVFLLEKDGKFSIEAIIDFERAFWADPVAEFISLAPGENMRDNSAFIDAYNAASTTPIIFDETYEIRLSLYRIYKYMTMYVESKYREGGMECQMERLYSKSRLEDEFKKLMYI